MACIWYDSYSYQISVPVLGHIFWIGTACRVLSCSIAICVVRANHIAQHVPLESLRGNTSWIISLKCILHLVASGQHVCPLE